MLESRVDQCHGQCDDIFPIGILRECGRTDKVNDENMIYHRLNGASVNTLELFEACG